MLMKFSGNVKRSADKALPMLLDSSGDPVRTPAQRSDVEIRHFAAAERGTVTDPQDLMRRYLSASQDKGGFSDISQHSQCYRPHRATAPPVCSQAS